MPFRSAKQRRYLWANEPEIARRWTKEHGSRIQKDNGGIMRLPFAEGDVTKEWEIDFHSKDDPELYQIMITAAEEAVDDFLKKIDSGEIPMPENLQWEMDKIHLKTKTDILKQHKQQSGGGGGGAKRIGVLGDEGMNLEEFMDERLEERIEKEKRAGLPSLQNQSELLFNLSEDEYNKQFGIQKEPYFKKADPGQPVWDMGKNKYYDSITGREVPNPNIPQKRNMDTMPYIKEPFSPIGQFASFIDDEKGPVFNPLKLMSDPQSHYLFDEDVEEDNVPLRFKNAKYLSDYFNRKQNALRRDNRYFNRGDATTGPEKWMGGLRNVGGDIWRGLGSIPQRVSNFMGNRFQYKPAVGRTPMLTPAGTPRYNIQGQPRSYSAAQLNQLNALGGYYSQPARDERFRQQRIGSMLTRAAKGKPIGDIGAVSGGTYIKDSGGNVRFTGRDDAPSVGQQTSGRADKSWKHDPFAKGGLASIWPR